MPFMAAAAGDGGGRAYVMKGARNGADEVLADIVQSFGFGTDLGRGVFLDLLYKNEGQADEGHRDGFGAQLFYRRDLAGRLSGELGAGVLWTFNTTRQDGVEVNDKRRGLMVSAALLYRFRDSFYLRAQYDRVNARGSFRTDTLLVGLQADFERRAPSVPDGRTEATALVGITMMNTSAARAAFAYQAEVRRSFGAEAACSLTLLREQDNRVASRESAGAQCWYVKQASPRWRLGAGAGPLLVYDYKADESTRLGALLSLEASRSARAGVEGGVRFSRLAVPGRPARDADLFMGFARVVF